MKSRKAALLIVLAVAVIAGVGLYARKLARPREFELKSATITKLDFEYQNAAVIAARGEIEFVHPKSGQKMTVSGLIPADCPILVNGEPGRLAELHIGDRIAARGTLALDRSIRPQWVSVQRDAAASQPGAVTAPPSEPRAPASDPRSAPTP